MRKLLTLVILSIISHSVISQGFTGDTWAQALRTKNANVVLTNAYLPKFSDNGKGVCFDIMDDFADYVQRTYGVTVNFQYKPVRDPSNFQSFLTAVKNSQGGVFGLGDITITDQRKTVYDFTPPYFSNRAILITKTGVPQLTSLSKIPVTFKGMRAVSQRETTHDKRLTDLKSKYGDFEIIYASSSSDKAYRVITSPKYFTYIDLPDYLELFSKGETIQRHKVGDVQGESFGFIMPKGNDWTPIITEFFNANGGYTKSAAYRKVFGDNLSPEVVKLMEELSR